MLISQLRFTVVPLLLSLLFNSASATSGSDFVYGAHPRFVCTPLPVDADPACFPPHGASVGGSSRSGHQSAPPAGWWGTSEEAKATILHLRESLVQQKETILDQRETIRELTAKLSLCEGFGRNHHEDQHGMSSHHFGAGGHHQYADSDHHNNHQGYHGNFIPDSPHHLSVGGHRNDGGHSSSHQEKDKQATSGEGSSSPEQMERMLQALKERLNNLQKRNTSITYSSSLKELLQRKISTLEEQLHHSSSPYSHHGDGEHHDDDHHHDDHEDHSTDHMDDEHIGLSERGNETGHNHDDHSDGHRDREGDHDNHNDSYHDDDSHHEDERQDRGHQEDGHHDDSHHDDGHHGNDAAAQSYLSHTSGSQSGFHPNKLETMLNQLAGSNRKRMHNPDAFQISFPMRTNYMYGRVKTTLLQEIFALTLCLWLRAGVGPGMGTPFSYSAPGQANELVLIEWGSNPMELLIDDKAVTLPLTVSDGKWHHVCVTWSTREGHWEAYQDGMQRGSGMNLSPWHPIKPGGVFILGQEQDTLGGRFDATQSFVGELSDLQMWSHVLSSSDIYSLASCGSHLRGDVISWSDTEVELHGGVTQYAFDPCH
ncbi:neuronal pentraxin-1 [Synchiropus splendidus]|uniref:neuronal pentraxin-1 n=1 Tax=Synchiropus splendidus TaxID=270530 RepID=UPI00237EBA8E|nr:neuronal pentraxin-1 [Synchiropus splendidus]